METPLTFAFLKDRYDHELERQNELMASLSLPVGILTGLGGLIAVMARTCSYDYRGLTRAFLGLLVLDAGAFVTCLAFLGLVYHRQEYQYLPRLDELENSAAEFEAYFYNDPGRAEEEFTAQVRRRIIEAADANAVRNDEKSKFLSLARISLFATLVLTAFVGATYITDQARYTMAHRPNPPLQEAAPQDGQQSKKGPPPQVPPNRIIREGSSPRPATPADVLNRPSRRG